MPRCEATTKTPGRDNTGNQCKRMAVKGATRCERHGGVEETRTPAEVRKRIDHPAQRCTAHRSDGKPCRKYAIRGAVVCRTHGGALPNVRKAAHNRMLAILDPAVAALHRIVEAPGTSDADRLRAISLVLDRTGLGPKSEVSFEVKKYETVMSDILRIAPPEPEEALALTPGEDGSYGVTTALPSGTTEEDQGGDDWSAGATVLPVDFAAPRRRQARNDPPRHQR